MRTSNAPPEAQAPRPVVVVSHRLEEPTTDEVLDWLMHYGVPVVRVNGDGLTTDTPFRIAIGPSDETGETVVDAAVDGARLADAGSYWHRRWHTRAHWEYLRHAGDDAPLAHRMFDFLRGEVSTLRDALLLSMPGAYRITGPEQIEVNKLRMLSLAGKSGLRVPATLLTNSRDELLSFVRRHDAVITKPIADAKFFNVGEHKFGLYTTRVTEADAAQLPERFFPSLFQQCVEKAFELRVFVLEDGLWPMAIFSQEDDGTQTDYRRRARATFNRLVPYSLPHDQAAAVRRFMAAAGLTTGSIDLIRARDGGHWFLEVNPTGQFGMVSAPCNYHLERRVARRLAEESGHVLP